MFLHIERASFLPGLCSHYSALVEPGAFVAIGDPATANVDHVAACGDLFLLVVVLFLLFVVFLRHVEPF